VHRHLRRPQILAPLAEGAELIEDLELGELVGSDLG
jgi:hypothetical protein